MDILGGAGICRGPRNLLANIYIATPIPVTVEGANILTRTMMIFGQGVIRCHPFVYQEVLAIENNDVKQFDQALWHHLGLMVRNSFRVVLLSLTRGYLARPPVAGPTARYYQKLAWAAAIFAWLTDLSLLGLGGSLKRRETITGRFADVLSWMYLGAATLRRFAAEGRQPEDLPYVHWAMQYALAQIQQAFEGLFKNLPVPLLGSLLRGPGLAWLRLNPLGTFPSDTLGSEVAHHLQTPGDDRDRLTANIYVPSHPDETLGRLEQAMRLAIQAEGILKTIKAASKGGQLPPGKPERLIEAAVTAGIISQAAANQVREAERLRLEAIQVDAFTLAEYQGKGRSLPEATLSQR